MLSATEAMRRFAISGVSTASLVAKERSTKANSPPCARANANRNKSLVRSRNQRPSARRTRNFTATMPKTICEIAAGCRAMSAKSMLAPTEMKKSPSSNPLNGSMSASSCTRYSLSASTTPAMKVPSAGERPSFCISIAIPTTMKSAVTVNISRSRVAAM
jgi:hypothetical protein